VSKEEERANHSLTKLSCWLYNPEKEEIKASIIKIAMLM